MKTATKVKVFEKTRIFGTKAKTKGPGHAKSVTKARYALEVGSSVFQAKEAQQTVSHENDTHAVVSWVDVPGDYVVRALDAFERKTDNLKVSEQMATYTQRKREILSRYGVTKLGDLPEAARAVLKKELNRFTFYYREYQLVIWTPDGKILHSHKMKSMTRCSADQFKRLIPAEYLEEDSSPEEDRLSEAADIESAVEE
jgi:hypothetical protein